MVGDNTLRARPLPLASAQGPTVGLGYIRRCLHGLGIGVVVNGKWDAWSLCPGWKSEGRNIGWLEALAVEFLVYILEANDLRDVTIPAHSDNQGVIGAFEKGRSRVFLSTFPSNAVQSF